jgi:hypothetical protein
MGLYLISESGPLLCGFHLRPAVFAPALLLPISVNIYKRSMMARRMACLAAPGRPYPRLGHFCQCVQVRIRWNTNPVHPIETVHLLETDQFANALIDVRSPDTLNC